MDLTKPRPIPDTPEFRAWLNKNGYLAYRQLPDGHWAGLIRLATTIGLCVGTSWEWAYWRRYCYLDGTLARGALADLRGIDDMPEGWVAMRPEPPWLTEAKSHPGYRLTPYKRPAA